MNEFLKQPTADPDGMNEERADRAAEALQPYCERGADKRAAVLDLLADLMHYCHAQGIDFDAYLELSRNRYAEETTDPTYAAKVKEFGEVTFEGKSYALIAQADFSNRVFVGWFGDAQEGEEYTVEFAARAVDAKGDPYEVYWQFETVKGEEPGDLSDYPFDDAHITRVWSK